MAILPWLTCLRALIVAMSWTLQSSLVCNHASFWSQKHGPASLTMHSSWGACVCAHVQVMQMDHPVMNEIGHLGRRVQVHSGGD